MTVAVDVGPYTGSLMIVSSCPEGTALVSPGTWLFLHLPRPQALGLREKAGPQVLRSPDNPRPHLGAPGASSAPQPWAGQLNQPAHSAGFPPSTLGERGKYSQEIKSSHGIPCRVPGSCPHNPRH